LTIDELIDQLQANGYKNHSRAAFKQKLYNSPSFRRELYDANGFKSHGIGYKDFESKLNINNGTIAQSNSEYEEDKRTKSIDDGADKDGQGVIDFAQNVVRHVTDGLMSSSSGLSKAIGNTAISLYGGVTGSDMTNTHAEFNKSMDDARDKLQALMGSPINYISDQIDSDDEDAAAAKSVKRYKEEREAQNKRYELEVWDDTKGVGENIVSLPYKVLSQPVEALSIALSTTGDIFLAKSSVGTRFFGMGVDGAYDELKKINAENPDLHLDDHPNIALGYSASVGVIQGLFEKYSVDKILGPAASKRAANYVLNKAVREITKRGGVITTELLEKEVAAVSRRIGTKVGAAALNTLVATGVEGSEELFTEMGNDAIRIMTNHIGSGLGIDGDIFDIDEMKNTAAERYLTNFAAGAVGGAGLGMTHGLFNNSSDYIRYTYATENNKDEARAQIDSEIQNSRKYSDEMKSALLGYSELMHDMSTKIDNDADIDTKKKMMALLGSKSYQISKVQSLEQKIATIDDSLKEAQQPLLDREKAKLAHINNVILATYKGNDLVYNEKDGQYTKTIGDETSTISELEYMIGSVAQLQDKRKDGDATDDEDGSFADDDADLISDLTRGVEAVSDIPVEVIKPLDVGTKIEYNGVRGEVVEIDRLKDGSIRSIKLKDDDGNDTFVFINGKDIEEYGIQIISDENTRQTNDDGSVGEENQSEAQTEDGGISEGESTITAVEGEPSDIGIADDDGSTKEGQKEQEPLYKSDPGYVSELEKEHSRLTKERDEYISDIAELKAIDPTFDENGEETAKAQRIYDDGIKNAEEKARTNSINKRRDADIKKAKDIGKRKGIDVTKTIENINKKYDEELGENQKENEVGHTKVSRVLDSQIDDENFPRENIESHPIFQSNARKAKESKGRAEGKAFKKTLANGEVITGKYILINKNDVFASHRAHSFSKTPGVPVNKNGNTFNDNDYERSKTAQAKQIKDANNYDQRAIEDPVLIDRNGVVKSGNGRTISRQMSNAKSSQKYTNELKERAEEFGFTKEQVEAIGDEDVMLAVELDGDPVYTTKEYAKYNEDSTKKKTPTEDAIVKAKSLDEKTISQMASVFEDSDVMSDLSLSDIDRLRNILINNGVISETNQSLYFDENGKLTASGSELIENILLASIFNENEIRTLSKLPSIRKKLAQNRVRLLNNRRKEETSVINLVRRAISIIGLSTSYSGSFEDKLEQYITQSDMFDVVDSDKDVVLMAILINDASKFRQLLDSLNNIVEGEDLFGNTIDSASVLSSVYDMVHDELSDKQKLVLEKAGYNINIEEYEKQEEGNETVSDKGKDGLTSGRQEGNIGTVSDGKNKSETGGKENVSRGEVGLGFKEILQRTPLSNDSKKVLQFILKKFPYIANNVDFIEDQKVWDDLVGSDEYGGWYATDDETGRIVILLNPKKKAGRDETILHEVIHAFTQTIIDNPRTAAEREYVAQITELYNKFKSIKGVSQTHAYIYDDIHEFVTYTMTNTPFQRFLRNRLSTRSLFDKVIDAIRNMFGFPSNDIVNKVISSTKAIISTTDYSNIQERILDGYRAQKGAKIDISTQGSNKTNKVYETKVETKSGKGETVQFKSSQGTNDYTSSDNIQREGDKVKSSGIGRTIAGVWNKFKNIQFTGTTKVKNAADVAHIMRLLEDKSVEHAFAVHIDSKGNSHIQFLSIGGVSGTVVDPKLVLSGVAKFKSKKVYLVHNHPSGNMTPSNADRDITKKITEGLSSLTTEFEHIIMDTYKQEYLVLDKYGYTDGRFTREKREEGRKLSTHIFDGAKVLTEPLAKITSSSDVAEFLYQKRFSVLPKNGYLILNQQNNIIGNFSFKGDVNVNELLLSFGETATAKSVIMYGNSAPLNLNAISVRLNKLDVGLLDYVEVKGGGNDVKGAYDYISAADSGLLNEVQAKYGTNMVNEPVNDSSDLRFQILGEKGAAALDKYDEATHRMDNLEVARQMEEAGKTEKEIRRATGWERGVDKLWRYEILDIDLIKRFGDNTKIKSALRILGRGYEIELKQLDRFNDLIKAYPKLNRLKVRLGYLSTAAGSYGGDTITLSEYKYRDVIKDIQFNLNRSGEFGGAYVLNDDYLLGKLNELTSTLLHEIQHAIQEIEGFARGGSPTQFMNWNIERLREDNEKNAEILRDLIKEGEKKGLSPSEVMSIGDGLIASNNLSKLQNAIYEYENAPELYRSLAGEVEARNVGQRIGMTPEQRRETLLTETEDVAREDQIVMMDGVEQAMSLSDSESQPITEAESKTLTDWLNKAFGGAVKIFSDWEDFEKIAKERGVSDGDIDNVRLSIKKIGRTGKQIDFGSTNVSGVSKGLRNFFVRNLFDYDFNIARTGSQYFSFNNGLVDGNIRVSNHTKADDNIRIGSRNSYDVEVYEDGTVHFDIDTIHNNLTSKDISKSLKAVQDIMSKVIADSDALIKDIKTIFNTDKSISEKKQDAFSYLSSKIDTSRIDSNLIDVFIPELAMSLNKAEQGVDFAKERYNEVIKKQEDKKERLIAALERTRVNNEREKKAKEAYNRFKKGEITAEEYSKEHSRIYNNSDIKLLQYPDGTVYGAVLPDGSMYLNPERLNANTPIHEHTHLFNQVIQKTNPKLWDKIVEATKKTELWEEVKNDPNYANLKTDSQIADEVFSRFVGDKGEGSWQERIAKADSKSRLAKVGELIKEYWNAIKEFFGVDIYKGMTADDFANMTLDKLFSGKEIKGAEEAIGVKDDKSVVKKMMIGGKEVEVKTLPQVTNGFYSPIEKKLLDEKATNLSATKWLERLGKGDEMQFTGLKDFLESKKPNEQVKKSDIQDFMRDNRIEVVEVVKLDRPFREIKKAFENVGNEWEEVYGGVYAKLSDKSNEYERRYNLKINGVEYGRDFTYLDAKSYVEANAQTNPEKNRSKFSQYQLEGQKENYKEIMIVLPREGSMKKVGDYTVPSAHKYGEDLADNRRVVHLRMNTRTDADGNKVLFLEEVQSDHNQEARKKGVRNEKEMKRISELADLFLEDRTKNQEGTPERIEYEKLTARNNTQGVPDAPFIKDTNATTKLGLKVALKEAVAQGADKISWTTGEQQNERYDLSKQVDEIGWQKNENGTYNITPKKDGSVIGTREMMANLTIKQIEDYVGKEVAEKIQNEEGKVGDGGSVKQGKLTGQQLKVGGKGMIGFYGNPSEGKLGIVGQVAKSLFKQEPQTIELQNTVTLSGNQNKILRFRDWVWANETKDYSFADAEKDIENNNELYAKYQSSIPTQHAITITPEMRQQVQEGLPLFNVGLDVARFMVKSQLKSDKVMFNISDKYWNDLGKVVNDAKNVEDLNNALDIISDAIFQKYSKKRAVISNNRVRAQVRMLQSTNPREMAAVISNAGVMFKTDADDYSEGDLEKLKKPAEDLLTKSRIDIGQKWNEVLKNYPSSVRYLVYRGIYKFVSKESEAYPIGYIKEAFDSTIQRFSESDSPQNFDFYTEYNQSIIDLLGEDRDSVINVDTDNGISGTWIKMNKASDSNDIEATKIKVAAASNGTSWCTKQTDTSGTGAKKVIEEDDHDFYVFFPKNTTQATIAIVPIREGEEEQLVNNSWYTGVFKQSNASDNNVDPEYYETVNQLAKKTKDKDLAYTLEKIGYSGLSKEEIKELQRQKDKVKLDWFENHSGEIFTDEDIEDINRIYGISIIVNGDQLGLHEWTEGIEEQLPESIRKDFGNKLFKSISYIELDANFNGSQVQSLGNLQSIGGNAYFEDSQVQSLGNLQSIGGYANFNDSQVQSLGNLQSIGGDADFMDSKKNIFRLLKTGDNVAKEKALRIKDIFTNAHYSYLANLKNGGDIKLFNDFLPAEFRLRREEIDVNLSHNSDEIRFSMSESAVNQADKAATVGNTDPIGKVVINLNKSGATKEAQIKEFASAWITVMQRQSASFINRGLELVADTEYIKETRGDAMLALQNAIADHTSKLKKTDKLIGWVKSFWVRVGKMLRINISSDRLKEMTIGEFLDIASAQLRYTNDIISELLADSTSDNKAIETEGKKSEENYREESISEREKKLLDEYESLIANMDNEGGKSDTRQNNMSIEEEYDFIGRDLSDNTQALVRTNGKEYDSMLQSLVGSAKKVVETIAFLMPTLKNAGISVTLHKSTSSYYNAVANNGGSAIEATRSFAFYKDGQIHINIHKPGIKANVAIHEALHPIIRDLLVNNKPVFDRFVNDILNDKELRKKYYDDFAMARYSHLDGDKISEEAIIEASADIILARIIKGLDAASDSVFNRVLKYIKEALGKTYGKLFEHVNTRADFNAFANTLADGISKGMVISFNREGKAAIKEIVENAASIADGNNTKNITGEKVDNDDAINNKKQASGLSQSIQDNRAQQKRAIQSKLIADILTNPDINWEHIASKLVTSGVLTKDEVDDILNGWRQKNASVNTVGKNMSSDQTLMAIEGMAELLHLRNMTEDDDVRITHEAMDELVANLDGELSDSLLHYTPYEVKATIKRIADSGLAHPVNILQIFHNVINSGNVPGHEKFIAMGIAISQLKSSLKKYKDIYKKTGDKHSADMVDSINDMLLRLAAASKTASSLSGAALGIHSKLIELGGLTYEGQLIELDGINKRGKNIEIEESDKKQINALVNKINELQAALDKAITSNETKNDGDKEKETTYRTIRKVNAGKQPILSKEVLLAKLRKLRASSTSFSLAMSVSDPSDMSYNEIIVELIKVAHIDGAVTFKDVVEAVKGYDNQITENDIYNAVISQTHESKAKRLSELAQREATTKRHARDIARLEKMIKDDIAALLVNNKVPDTNRMHSIRKLLYDIEKNIYSIDTTGSIMATQQNAIDQIRDNYDIAFLHPSPDKSTEDMLSSIVNAIRMLHDAKYKAWIEETYRNLKKEIDNINEAIKNGTFAKTVSPSNDTRKEIPTHISVPVFDDDGEVIGIDEQEFNYGRILRDISTMRREIEAIKNKYRNSESAYHKWYVRFRNTIGGSMAMMDLSYFAVQGYRALTLFWRNPKMFIQAFSKSISVMADEFSRNPGKADIIYKQIVENPYYQRAVSLGLVISDPEAHIHIKEEIGGDDYFDIIYDKTKNKKGLLASTINVPLKIRKKVKTASNASFATHLNLISINTVSAYIERVVSKTGEQPSDKELEAIIRDVNNSTGRPHFKQGSHGGKIAVGASYVLWAPKLYASQIFNIANIALDPIKLAYYASRGEKDMTRAYMYKAANSVLAFATTTAVIYGLRAMLAKIQCGDNVGYNTEKGTSRSNWMKIQCGDWSFDPTGNHRQWIRLGYNLIKTVQNEPPVDYRGEKISPSQQIFNVLRYKSNPALAFVSSLFTGTDFMNRRYYADDTSPMQIKSRGGVIKDAFIPIFGNNLVDLYKFAMSDNSERLRLKPLVAVEQVLGFGVTYIDPKEKEERKEIEKKEKADSKKEKSEDALQKLIKEGLPKEYSEGEFQDNVDWSNISLTDKQYKSKDGKRRQVFRHISDTNHDGKENDCFVWRTRIRGKRKGEKYKERVPCE